MCILKIKFIKLIKQFIKTFTLIYVGLLFCIISKHIEMYFMYTLLVHQI